MGEVTGMVDFGVFMKIEEGLEGLVHISEIDWGLVEDPRALFKAGEKVKVKVIEVKDYDIRTDRWNTNMYVITDKENLGEELGQIITKESLCR